MRALPLLLALAVSHLGCDAGSDAPARPVAATKPAEPATPPKPKMTEAEREKARYEAGFRTPEQQMAEAKAEYEKSERSYIKARIKDYRKLVAALRAEVDAVETQASKWAKAKAAGAAHAKWKEGYARKKKAVLDRYDAVSERGTRGGDLQASLAAFVQTWEGLIESGAEALADPEQFNAALTQMRTTLADVGATLDEIDKDDSIHPEAADGGTEPAKDE